MLKDYSECCVNSEKGQRQQHDQRRQSGLPTAKENEE